VGRDERSVSCDERAGISLSKDPGSTRKITGRTCKTTKNVDVAWQGDGAMGYKS